MLALTSSWNSVDRVSLETSGTTHPPADDDPAVTSEPTITIPSTTTPDSTTTATSTSTTNTTDETAAPTTTTTPTTSSTAATTTTTTTVPEHPEASDPPSVLALVGTDSRSDLEDTTNFGEFAGERADVIALAIRRGDEISLLSVPRDLFTNDICNGGHHRISSAYQSCGEQSGLSNLVAELEVATGLEVEHAVAVDLAGFHEIVDTLGGYEICTEYPLRDRKSGLELDDGCTMADGATTLAWLRSRYTERYVDGHWEYVPGVSDLTRNERQRQFLIDVLHGQSDRSKAGGVLDIVEAAAPHMTIDDQLSLTDAASWIWDLRNAEVETHEIPVAAETTSAGAEVLVPTVDIEQFVDELS